MTDNEQVKKANELAEVIFKALEDKKGIDTTLLEVGKQTVLADYFVICTGTSNTHVKALAGEVEFKTTEELGIKPNHIEGYSDNTWTLLDYGSVIVHIFTNEGREFYKLEKLWKDASVNIIDNTQKEDK
ncbi:MAG: ribosome silencing factor [Firmicutes bacterium HGW-Firmicutes-21]|nr:MAG: ribosome silencing factor [Firmicutes bacterium HGW-Firmicutes-21]